MIRKIKVEKKHFLAKYLTRLVADVNRSNRTAQGGLPVSLSPTDGGVLVRVNEEGLETKYHIVEAKRVWRYTVEHSADPMSVFSKVPDLSLPIRTLLETLNDFR